MRETENPAYTLEKFLTLLRKQEEEVDQLESGIRVSDTKVPGYVALLKDAITKIRYEALAEAAEAAERVKRYGESIHNKFISDAKEVIDRMERIQSPFVTRKDLNSPRPSDLMYVGEQFTVSVTPNNQPENPNDTF